MGLSTYIFTALLSHLFGKATYTPPAAIFVALSTTPPTDAGTNVTPPSGNGYARAETAPADWNSAAAGDITNLNAVTFPDATGPWGTVAYFALYDAGSGGNFLGWGTLATPRAIMNLDTPIRFAAGTLEVS